MEKELPYFRVGDGLSNTIALAQDYRGTPQQRASCTRDAFRLRAIYIPEAAKVETCLRQKKLELSEPCRSVFDQNANSTVR